MRALSVWQPWATTIILAGKPYEFRRWRAPAAIVGQRIVIHAAKRPVDLDTRYEFQHQGLTTRGMILNTFVKVYAALDGKPCPLPFGAGLGTVELGQPVRCTDLWPGDPDIDEDMWAWPMLDPQPWAKPIPARGFQGFWRWPEFAREGQ
jgi:hypothetical protein